jgi:hypothetical protein
MINPNASTVSAELARQQRQTSHKATFKSLQQKIGTIIQVHNSLPMVKVQFDSGANAAGGDWIPVMHSVLDILQRFGSLRNGLRVLVTYFGEVETIANATIIGIEGEQLGAELQQDNEMNTPCYAIFQGGL